MKVTVFGKGNMGCAIKDAFVSGGNDVNVVTHEDNETLGEIVVLAVPYSALDDIISRYKDALAGKVVIDITNPVNFETFDDLVVPADSSAAKEIQDKLPNSMVVKGFNTNFAATLASGKVADGAPTTVLLASDSQEAKDSIARKRLIIRYLSI